MNTWKQFDPYRPLDEAFKPSDMRAAIERARMDNALVRQALDSCRLRGMSAEDTYTVLAYHALQTMIQTQRRMFDYLANSPLPMYVLARKEPS